MADLLALLNATNSTGNQPPINSSGAISNIASQQLPYNPPPLITNIGVDIRNPQNQFLDALSQYAASVPLKSFWMVSFNIPFLIGEQNLNGLSEIFRNNDHAINSLSNNKLTRNIGCIFCRSFNFAGENNFSTVPEMEIRGFRSVPYVGSRSSGNLNSLSLSFYESSVSFIDHVIRPWIILMSYYSSIARNNAISANKGIYDLKQDITCYLMTRTGVGKTDQQRQANAQLNSNSNSVIPNYNNPWNVRKTIVFKNCFPKDMGTLDYTQSSENSLETVLTNFCYTNYEITFNPLTI